MARCGKIGYVSARDAWRVVRRKRSRLRERDRKRQPPLDVYRCPICGLWHLRTNTDHIDRRRSWGWRKRKEEDDVYRESGA